jgi:SAM-dependent methyltransferase
MTEPLAHDPATLRFYAGEAAAYAARFTTPSPHLADFLARLPQGGRVLELGYGGGRDAAAMIAGGFDVDATDGTAALAAEATTRLGRSVRVMRFDELDADQAYAGVWAEACLLHVPRAGLPSVLARVWRALKPGGVHAATFKATGVEGRDRFGRLFNQLTAADIVATYRAAGEWDLLAVRDDIGGGYDGVQVPWVRVTLRRAQRV